MACEEDCFIYSAWARIYGMLGGDGGVKMQIADYFIKYVISKSADL
ncbi:MAG: hypothetical protein MPEBLZ_00023 [Candidatus Methanoperedens nitroreducens]|uniref:Uncharacterized protein n=1 Tax=Candidatus Methanoperedens nitratireducens TaxID=1392998 RepID=A0A0P8CNM1_9EURY|nr:MAG: hypothetical protein MPEBLZ_00023 [Candidatus Methanoperedens sp. BLZ1]